jgi:hypothetical protein
MAFYSATDGFGTDPERRFLELARQSAVGLQPTIAPTALQSILDEHQGDGDQGASALAQHLTENTPLTKGQAETAVGKVLKPGASITKTASGSASDVANQLSKDVSTATAPLAGIDIELSQPVMLNTSVRFITGLLFLGLAAFATSELLGLSGSASSKPLSQQANGLTAIAVGAVLATLVLVMGYGKVVIKGPSGAAKGGPAGTGAGTDTKGGPADTQVSGSPPDPDPARPLA